MSTPDTYAEQQRTGWPSFYYDFARKLERERDDYKARLAASVREIERLNIVNTALDESKENDELRAEVDRLTKDRNCEKRMRQDAEETRERLAAEVERLKADNTKLLFRCYNAGYMNGHHCTVEGGFTDIHHADMETYHAEEVAEIVAAMKGDA